MYDSFMIKGNVRQNWPGWHFGCGVGAGEVSYSNNVSMRDVVRITKDDERMIIFGIC